MAEVYINDTTLPMLRSFSVDMNRGTLDLTFDETINISTFRTTELTLVDGTGLGLVSTNYTIREQGEVFTSDDSPVVSLRFSEEDINAIKFNTLLFRTPSNSFITLSTNTVIDMSGNLARVRDTSSALGASRFLTDIEPPNLLDFELDLNASTITLMFDESVSEDFNPTVITLLNDEGGNFTHSYQIEGVRDSEVYSSFGRELMFALTLQDQIELKAFEDFATEPANTFLTATSDLVTDRSSRNNRNTPFNTTFPLRAASVLPDRISPVLVAVTRFDLSLGVFRLRFNEPVNDSSIAFELVTILSSSGAPLAQRRSLVGGETSYIDRLRTEIEIQVSAEDLLAIKLNDDLATNVGNTRIQLASGAIRDQAGNDVLASAALPVDPFLFREDTARPNAVSFSLDMNLGILSITFDDVVRNEPVGSNIMPIDVSSIAIQGDATGGLQDVRVELIQPLDHADITNSSNGYATLVFIPTVDLNSLKRIPNLATSIDNTFLTLTAETIADYYGNRASPIVRDNALPASSFVSDTTPPELVGFNLDIDGAGELELFFTETIEQVDLDVSQITLVGASGETFVITSVNFIRVPSSPVVSITLGEQDLNAIKSLTNLASSSATSSLAITLLALNDTNANPITEISISSPMSVDLYTPDRTRPELRSYDLDLNEGALIFTFTEIVNGSSFDPMEITITDHETMPDLLLTLTGGVWYPVFSNILRLNVSISNLNTLKQVIDLADNGQTTFVSLTSLTVRDVESNLASNSIVEIELTRGLQVENFIVDETSPRLTNFSLNLTSETLALTFDETVNATSLAIGLITLQSEVLVISSGDGPGVSSSSGSGSGSGLLSSEMNGIVVTPAVTLVSVTLTVGSENSSYSRSQDSTIIVINLGPDDLNDLKRETALATGVSDTYISFPNGTIADMSGNLVVPISEDEAVVVADFFPDTLPPRLVRFDLNLTSEILSLTFSEVANSSLVDVTQFTLIAGRNAAGINRTLTVGINGSTSSTSDNIEIYIYLGVNDLNEIKRLLNLATSQDDSYLVFSTDAARDMAGNRVVPEPASTALRVSLYTPDSTSPSLAAFNLDVNRGLLGLEFSETVNAASLNVSGITLHSAARSEANESFALTSSSFTLSSDGTRILVHIIRADLNEIKFLTDLAQDSESTYLEMSGGIIEDMNSNPVLPVFSLQVSTYIFDETGPIPESFALSIDTGILTISFDETVNVSSLTFMLLTIQSSLRGPTTRYNLTAGSIMQDNSATVEIQLSFHDLNQIKLDTDLATGFSNTFLSIEAGAVDDLASIPNPSSAADLSLVEAQFTADATSPMLLEFSVNHNSETLTLNFNEPVNAATLQATGITLLDDQSGTPYRLSDGNTSSLNGLQIVVDLTETDLNNIKELETLLVSLETSYISITGDVIEDMNGNGVVPIDPDEALNASMFVNDTTRPRLGSFDLDLNSNTLTLEFVETVNTSSINFTGIVLQQSSNSTNQYRLTDGSLLSRQDSTVIRFDVVRGDLNAIKARLIALTRSTTWLTLDEAAILDQNQQPVIARVNGLNALMVREYTEDRVPPTLESFVLDLDTDTLTLQFSETVNAMDSFRIEDFTVVSRPSDPLLSPPAMHTLGLDNGTRSVDIYEPVITVSLGRRDLNRLKESTTLATNANNTFIYFPQTAVRDMSGNEVVSVTIFSPRPVSMYSEDRTAPVLEVFDFDLNIGILTLYFSESVNPTTLDITQFTLQYALEALPPEYAFSFTGGITRDFAPTPVITLDLLTPDLNEIKRISQLATSPSDTYIRVARGGIQDMNGNFVAGIGDDLGLPVRTYTVDDTPPTLVSFDLNFSTERLILTFDETVDSSTWLESGFVVQNALFSEVPNLRLLEGGTVLTPDDTVVMIQLDSSDLNYIKSIPDLCTGRANTFLRLDNSSISDMAGNPVTPLVNGRAVQVRNFTPDDRNPIFIGFDLDINSGRLQLTFNETVDTSSLQVEEITLQSMLSSTAGFSFNSSTGTISRSPDQTVLLVLISEDDLNEIKRRTSVATSSNNTYLQLSSLALQDTNRNSVVASVLPVGNFTEDITQPALSSYDFDLDEGRLHFTFSETVRYRSFNLTEITVQSETSASPSTSSITLSGGTLLTPQDGISMSVELSKEDLDTIKAIRRLAMSRYSTFISLTSFTVDDMNGNMLVELGTDNARMASEFTADTTSPVLLRFELDMTLGMLVMTFSETIDTVTFDFSELTLQGSDLSNDTFQFQSSSQSTELDTVVYITISKADLDLLKENRQVATSEDDTYISLTNRTILDTSGNGVIPIPDGSAEPVQRYVRDNIPPLLQGFELDMNTGLLTLSYSETIDIFSLDPTRLTLQNQVYLGTTVFTLTGGSVDRTDGTVGYVTLSTDDLNQLKRLSDLGTCVRDDTYLSLVSNASLSNDTDSTSGIGTNMTDTTSSGSGSGESDLLLVLDREFSSHVFDMAGNPVLSIHEELALRVDPRGCMPDVTRPRLVDFTLNLHNSTLTLTFDETVNSSTLDLPELTFHNGQGDPSQSYRLITGYANNEELVGQVVIEVVLSNVDLNELKRREDLATEANNTLVSITQYLVLDMNGNRNVEIAAENSSEAELFIPDERSPALVNFELDLTTERLTLSFTETVNASSLSVEGITILNENFTSSRTLVGGYFLTPESGGPRSGPDDPVLVVQLSQEDLNYIKSVTDLATELTDTFISITEPTVTDTSGNAVEEISVLIPLPATRYSPDVVAPRLLMFDLDMNTGVLFFTFSETVNVSSLDVSEITLQASDASPFMDQLSFTPGNTSFDTFSVSPDWPMIEIQIGISDLNEIKRLAQLATSNLTTYVILTTLAIADMNGNLVVPIENGNATQVSSFTADATDPVLEFFSLDLDLGILSLTFDETVNFDTLNFTFIAIQNSSDATGTGIQLRGGEITNMNDNTTVEIILNVDDLNEIKTIRSLAASVSSTYLSLQRGTILDMNANPVVEINATDARIASGFTEDSTDPTLSGFNLDVDSGTVTLTFDETVEADSLDLLQITLQDGAPAGMDNNTYTLTGGDSSGDDSTVVTVLISFFDLNEIKMMRDLATSGSNSYISITNLTVADMNANPVRAVPDGEAMRVRNFTEDSTPPVLFTFDLDMDTGRIYFNFSETVDATTFNVTQFILQSAANASMDDLVRTFSLTEPNLLTGDEVVIVHQLLYFDLNTVKSIGGLATSPDDTYLYVTEYAIRDMNGNRVEPVSESDAVQVSEYSRDIGGPSLESFSLDMDLGALFMTFSETVNVSTLEVTEILLLNDEFNATQRFMLTTASSSASLDWPFFVVNIRPSDLNVIKRLLRLAVSDDTTFIELSENVIRDTAGNMNLPSNATRVITFTPDTTDPVLLTFDLDLTLNVLSLTFDETVSGRTLDPSQLTLISGREAMTSGSGSGLSLMDEMQTYFTNYTLTGGENIPLSVDSTRLSIQLTFEDRNEIKRLTDLAISAETTFVFITSNFVADTGGNPVVAINSSSAIPVSNFTADSAPPRLIRYDLDMDGPLLTLYFSETVDVESLNLTQLTLQASSELIGGETEFYALNSVPTLERSFSDSSNDSTIVVRIGEADANEIKFRTTLAVSANTTFLSLTVDAIDDMNGNRVVEIDDSNATRVQSFSRDATPPVLRSFTLNLTSERLTLSFDETVNFDSIQASLITIQSSLANDSTAYALKSVQPIGENSPNVAFNLSATPRDLNGIKLLSDLATDSSNTFVTLAIGAVSDLSIAPNPIDPVTREVDWFFADLVRPEILSFSADIDSSTLTLVFGEVVNASSLDPTAIRLQNSSSPATSYVDLTGKITVLYKKRSLPCT